MKKDVDEKARERKYGDFRYYPFSQYRGSKIGVETSTDASSKLAEMLM